MADRAMLEVKNLTVAYGPHRALEDVSIHVGRGEICVILGANGAGKSTLLKAIAGMVAAAPGARIANGEKDIAGLKPHAIVEAGVALVPEGRGIFGDLTVAENLQLGAYGRQARAQEKNRLNEVLALFPKLGERRRQVARTMSGGEQQMVAIGRALMSNPAILMLDEPSLGLSPLLTRDLFRSLAAVRETGVGILLVEQNAKQSLAIADRGYLLENGHIVGEDTAAKLANDPAVQAAYLGGAASHAVYAPRKHMPLAASGTAKALDTAEELARRAARIQRDHVASLRPGANRRGEAGPASRYTPGGLVEEEYRGMNGHAHGLIDRHVASGEKIFMTDQARELSSHAAEFAARAREVQAAHLAAMRNAASRGGRAVERPGEPASPSGQSAPSAPTAEAGSARDHAGFAHKVSAAHDAAMRAGAERARQAVKNGHQVPQARQAPAAATVVEDAAPARPTQDLASYARKVSAAHDAAMRAGASRTQAAANGSAHHSAAETKSAGQGQELLKPEPGARKEPVSVPPMASQLSRQAGDMARRARDREAAYLSEVRARQAMIPPMPPAEGDEPAVKVPPLRDKKDKKARKAEKKARKARMKELRKTLKKLKKEIAKLKKAGK